MKYIISGHPVILKNNKDIARNRKTGVPFIKSSERVDAYKPMALLELKQQRQRMVMDPINVKMLFYGAWKRGNGDVPDLSNLYQMPEDLLEQAGIIRNDRLIESHDGSRRVYMCDSCHRRPKYVKGPKAGQYKSDCGAVRSCQYERIEIEITMFEW